MAPNRKRLAIRAPEDRWKLLGELLHERRRIHFGHEFRPAFARARLPLTPDGNPNTRRVDDLESNRRPNRWPEPTLKEMAAAYEVSYVSMMAVLGGAADVLAPAAPAVRALPSAPMDDDGRENAVRPYATAIWDELLRLAAHGITSPSGALLGLLPADAKVWDGSAGAMSQADRAWLVADIQRRRDTRNPAAATA